MRKEDIERLPPELQPAAEIKRSLRPEQRARWERRLAEGMDETDDFPACTPDQRAILWTLMELKSAEQALESSLTWGLQMQEERDAAKNGCAHAQEITGKLTALWHEIAIVLDDAGIENVYLDEGVAFCHPTMERVKMLAAKLSTAEATIATLTRDLSVAMETIHRMGCNTDDCHECSALSHTPEGRL